MDSYFIFLVISKSYKHYAKDGILGIKLSELVSIFTCKVFFKVLLSIFQVSFEVLNFKSP